MTLVTICSHKPLHKFCHNHPVNMPDPICIRWGSAGKHWPEAGQMILTQQLASRPDQFGQNLTQSARTKSDQGWLCTILSRMSAEEQNQVWKLETGSRLVVSCQKPGNMIPAHRLASRDVFGQTLTRPSRSDLGQFCTIWSMPCLEKWSFSYVPQLLLAFCKECTSGGVYVPCSYSHAKWQLQ